MKRPLSLALRIGAIAAAGLVVSAGLAFAARSDGGQATAEPPLQVAATDTVYATPTSVPPIPTPSATSSVQQDPTVQPAAGTDPGAATPPASAPAMTPASAPRPSPTNPTVPAAPPTAPGPITDLPAYTDVAVLALAANAVLPSGMTFRECVELPPSHEKWPTPVHLYYEGKGRWLVETHVSEVQVVFDEATGAFRPRNFAPTNPGCR